MARDKKSFICSDCKHVESKWAGQCPNCKAYGTMEEGASPASSNIVGVKSSGKTTIAAKSAERIRDIKAHAYKHESTGIGELDRVLGGGLVPGASIVLAGPPGVGKALALDTPIITPTGWSTIGDLKVGDIVLDEDGNPTKVVALSETWDNRPTYKVSFHDGTSIIADENHEWLVTFSNAHRANLNVATASIQTTGEMYQKYESVENDEVNGTYFITMPGLIEFNKAKMNMDFKLLGLEFGAGHISPKSGDIKDMLRGSIEQRKAFLRGLMKKIGKTLPVGGLHFSDVLFDDVDNANIFKELLGTLGATSRIDKISSGTSGKDSFFVRFEIDAALWEETTEEDERELERQKMYVVGISKTSSVPVRCIEVEGESHLFLAGESMVPTHNSSILSHVASIMSMKSKVLYVSGEESVNQIKLRAERTNTVGGDFFLASENDLSKAMWHIDEINPDLIIVDSMQTIASPDIDGRAGSPSQVIEVATMFTRICKDRGIPLVMVGHFTKDGNVAGPRTVEHLVDVVLSFEGEDDSPIRYLRAIKNRFGAADEIGCFEHTEEGLQEVPDPSGLLLGERDAALSGVCSSIFLEGKRPLPVEIQALVSKTFMPNPRRVTSGLDGPRTLMLQAVANNRGGIKLGDQDVYVSTIAGAKIKENAVDLATIIAIASSALNRTVYSKTLAIGEVTLSGEIRKVPGMVRRLNEAVRLGFEMAFVPEGTISSLPPSFNKGDLVLVERKNVYEMVKAINSMPEA